MTFHSLGWFDIYFLPWLFASFILNAAVIYFWHMGLYVHLGVKKYQGLQRIHHDEIPRLGGLVVISCSAGYAYLQSNDETLKLMLLALLPVIIFSLKEDLFHNVKPMLRLSALFLTSLTFIYLYRGPWPVIDLPILQGALSTTLGIYMFYPVAIASISNGMNLIDGVNGLCAATTASILGSLLFLSHATFDTTYMMTIIALMLLLGIFLIFNYPYGKIFLGDLGAYCLGVLSSILTIVFYAKHPELPTWGAVLIMIYPATEIIFSVIRRTIRGVSLHKPDTEHLHMRLFIFLRSQPPIKKLANAMVTPALTLVWIFPLIVLPWVYKETALIFLAIFFFSIIYIACYMMADRLRV
jgi:UDP-N-acetylmuramyl pentapeptide phosphotransferase/UDP-N-acetylglucosamine-1-phosphate transferase